MPHLSICVVWATIIGTTVLTGSLLAQNFRYQPGDWEYFITTAAITSASEGPDGIYFSTYDGLLHYDQFGHNLDHLPDLNIGLPSRRLYQVYNDPSTNALWVVYDDGIAFRMLTDETWRQVPFGVLPDHFQGRAVTRVGGSFDGIWIDMDGLYTLLNSFTGEFIGQDIGSPDQPVGWNTSRALFYELPDVMGWITTGDWTTSINEFLGPGYITAFPTLVFLDRYNETWFGTDLGILFRGDRRTRRLEPLQAGVAPRSITSIYRDGDRVWFADNEFRRRGVNAERQGAYFLSAWDEKTSAWRYYSGLASEAIRDVGVNDMLRVGRQLWLATMRGILTLDTRTDVWDWIGTGARLRDMAVWDLESFDGEVFAATARGIDRIDPATRRVIAEDSLSASPFYEVYDLHIADDVVYAGTVDGIYEYRDKREVKWLRIANPPAISLWGDRRATFAVTNNLVFRQETGHGAFELWPTPAPPDARILAIEGYGPYIWLATSKGAIVYDRRDKRQFTFDRRDGLPSQVVYQVEPTADWVWFLTKEGVVRFYWQAYLE